MINSNRNIHGSILRPSCAAYVKLAEAIETNFLKLGPLYYAKCGEQLVFPESLNEDVLRWRTLCTRYKKGDFRHSPVEVKSCQAVADWTLQIKADVTGQPVQKIPWGEA
jgi:hypothetical protein